MSSLGQLYFGRDEAESDLAEGLLKAGFLRTAAFDAALAGRKRLIIGRKGSGKSAICVTLAASTGDDYEASVVVPDEISLDELRTYELQGVTAETSKSLFWRYMLGTQVAKYTVSHSHAMHRRSIPDSVETLRKFLLDNGEVIDPKSHKKFWSSLQRLQSLSFGAFGASASIGLAAPNAGLKTSSQLEVIEHQILTCLNDLACPGGHPRLLLLIDQLELVWSNDPQSDALVSGLLLAAKHVTRTFPGVRCIVFIRTDIYDSLQLPERDKFRGDEMHLDWTPLRLSDMVLARARASIGQDIVFSELWGTIFPGRIADQPSADYLISLTLGRPRDFIQLANLCRDTAEKNGNLTVTVRDIAEAEVQFSQWKLRDLADEYKVNYPYLADLFVLFQNAEYIIDRRELESRVDAFYHTLNRRFPGYVADLTADRIIGHLYEISFLGVRRGLDAVYSYQDSAPVSPDEREFHIHPCFRQALRSTRSPSLVQNQFTRSQATQPLSIALWGSPGSGKSTFLAALYAAASRSSRALRVYGTDDVATDLLVRHTHMLASEHEFPDATVSPQELSWRVEVESESQRSRRFGWRTPVPLGPQSFNIGLLDIPGKAFGSFQARSNSESRLGFDEVESDPNDVVIERLASCGGLILFFDPIREKQLGDSYDYFVSPLLQVAQYRLARMGETNGKLPQYLAVCITKFDDPHVYDVAKEGGYISIDPEDPTGSPRIRPAEAKSFFQYLLRSTDTGRGDLIPQAISRYFHPERVAYFITSSIGFYRNNRTGRFDPDDYKNVIMMPDEAQRIRGTIYPINVIEPVLWMSEHLAATHG